jgi:histidine triad (HIT) family protein
MELTPEIRAQLAEQKKQCIFCKIISKEQEGKIVFEDDKTMAVLDIYPALKGHILYFLKEHYPIMPYIPADEFKHLFGLIPQLSEVLKKSMLSTGVNVFIANGGPAGQRAPHFMLHLFPRENADGFFNLLYKKKSILAEDKIKMLSNNLPLMMTNHFKRNPADWHTGKGDVPSYLSDVYDNVIYEDEKVLCVVPKKGVAEGDIEIHSKLEEKYIEKLSIEDASHLFYAASFAATAVFEGLGAHATNIILKSGEAEDNPQGKLVINVIPRWQEDSLQGLLWEPKQPSYDLDKIAGKIKDKTWKVKYAEKNADTKKEASSVIQPKVIKIGGSDNKSHEDNKPGSAEDEIRKAIEGLK